jgi:hypothetical protein
MTAEVAQSRTSKRVATAVVAVVLRSFVDVGAAIKALFRASNAASVERRSESATVETAGVAICQIPAHAEVELNAGTSPIGHNELSQQEIERRRSLVRAFFNDFWSGTHDKPAAFVERLDQAEDYLNERLTASGEVWRLDAKARIMLGLPPRSS